MDSTTRPAAGQVPQNKQNILAIEEVVSVVVQMSEEEVVKTHFYYILTNHRPLDKD